MSKIEVVDDEGATAVGSDSDSGVAVRVVESLETSGTVNVELKKDTIDVRWTGKLQTEYDRHERHLSLHNTTPVVYNHGGGSGNGNVNDVDACTRL